VIREGGAAVPLHAAQKLVESGIGVFLLPFVAPHILFFGAFAPPEIRELRPQYKITPMQDLWNQYIADIQAALADRDAPEAHLGADVLQHFSADGISGLNTYLALNFEHLFPINIAWIRVHDQQWPIPLKNWIPQIRDYIKGRLGQAGIHLFSRYFLGLNTFKLVLNLQEDSRVYQGKNFFTPKDNATYDLAIEVYDSNGQITATINITTLTLTYPTKNFEQNSYATMFSKKLNKLPTTILLAIVHQFYSYAVDNKERPNTILTMLPPADALPNLTDIGPLRQKMVALEKCLQDFLLQKENATLPHSRGTAGFVAAHQEALILTAGQCAALLKELDRLILMMQGQLALAGINAADMPRERMPVNSIGYPQLLETGAMPTQLAPNLTNLAYKTGTEKQVEENLGRLSDLFKKPSTEEGRAGANAATPGPGGQGQRL
jgi:hypothetical protein